MSSPEYHTKTMTCKNPECGKKFEAQVASVIGVKLVIGGGLCPDCRRVKAAEEDRKEKAQRDFEIKGQRRLWRKRCGIPPMFQGKNFNNFDKRFQARHYNRCLKYANEYPISRPAGYRSLYLFSQDSVGVGKTHLVCSIGHRILDRWDGENVACPVLFISEPELYLRIQATYQDSFKGHESEASILRGLTRVSLLIMDDVGKRSVTDPKFVRRVMFSIIDGRYTATLPIVLTSNLSPEQLSAYMGEASADRLAEMCEVFYQMEGDSYRIKE